MLSCRSKRAEGSCLGQALHGSGWKAQEQLRGACCTAEAGRAKSMSLGQVLPCIDWECRGLLLRSQGQLQGGCLQQLLRCSG